MDLGPQRTRQFMTRTDFVSEFRQLYTDIRDECHGSIVWNGDNLTRAADDDPPGLKPSIRAANALFDLYGEGSNAEEIISALQQARHDARVCREINAIPTTNPKADCRPIIKIDETGWPLTEWMK